MNVLRRLFGGQGSPPDNALHLYVRCSRCGAPVHVRVNLSSDLAVEFGDSEEVAGYHLRKEIMDSRCFRLIYADLSFDRNRHELARVIEGGEFIDKDAFERLSSPSAEAR